MKALVVGDPHVVVDELDECRALGDLICKTAADHGVDVVLFLGDLHNNHSVIRVEVIDYWTKLFARLTSMGIQAVALVGNHDMPQAGLGHEVHALMVYVSETVSIVDQPVVRFAGHPVGFMPYMATADEWASAFLKMKEEYPGLRLVFCHQTFSGSRYENGFYAPGGVDTAILGDVKVISGHIHSPQTIGNVWYPGAPRWRTRGDANVDRHLYVVEVEPQSDGYEVLAQIPTDTACTPIVSKVVSTQEELDTLQPQRGLKVTIRGDESFVKKAEERARSLSISFRSQVEAPETNRVRESDGVWVAFDSFLGEWNPLNGSAKEALSNMAAERLRK